MELIIKKSWKKCFHKHDKESNYFQLHNNKTKHLEHQHIRMISEDFWNFAITGINYLLKCIKIENIYFKFKLHSCFTGGVLIKKYSLMSIFFINHFAIFYCFFWMVVYMPLIQEAVSMKEVIARNLRYYGNFKKFCYRKQIEHTL